MLAGYIAPMSLPSVLRRALLLGGLALSALGAAAGPLPPLRFLHDLSVSPPFLAVTRDEQGSQTVVGGLLVDLNRALAAELGREAVFVPTPRRRVEQVLQAGGGDLLCYIDPSWLAEPQALDWSTVYLSNVNLLVARAGLSMPASLAELRGVRVGTVAGYVYPELAGYLGSGGLLRDDAPNDETNLRKLAAGRTDYLVTHRIYLEHVLKRQPELGAALGARLEIRHFDTRCAVSRRGQISVQALDAALDRLRRDGRLAAILAAYR